MALLKVIVSWPSVLFSASVLPPWFKGLEESRSFVVLPIVTGKTILGAMYADRAKVDTWSTPEDLEMLVTLKNQIVMAVKARQRAPT